MGIRPLEVGIPPQGQDDAWWRRFVARTVEWSRTMWGGKTYTVSNVTTTRTFDADSTTLAEVADVLGTLIDDLRNGRLPE